MKTIKLITTCMAILFSCALFAQDPMKNNLDSPPKWGPEGYTDVRYYYLPDVESYYDIMASQFICNIDGTWVHKTRLQSPHRNYDLYEGYKIVMEDYFGSAPYKFFEDQKTKYPKGYRGPTQKTIGENPNSGKKNKDK